MNNKILVPTDFSVNSKAGIRFAMQLASQNKHSLIFYHCIRLLKPTRWSEEKYQSYVKEESDAARNELNKFVREIYKTSGKSKPAFSCIVQQGLDVHKTIINYAVEIKAGSICMGTRGAGRLKKVVCTNASEMIAASPIPVFIIPKSYRRAPVTRILYSSDFNNLGTELKLVRSFARPLKAKISIYHYDYLADETENRKKLVQVANRFKGPDVRFNFQKFNLEHSLAYHLKKDMRKAKASVAVLFTDQKRGWLDKIFLSGKSVRVAFDSKVPLLIFPKKG